MHKGACIVASNVTTDDGLLFDYINLAKFSAKLIRKHLNLPVALLTSSNDTIDGFEVVVRLPMARSSKRVTRHQNNTIVFPWDNDYRVDSFQYSPWDRTLLIDADYLVLSDHLKSMIDCDHPFMIMDDVYDVTGRNSFRNMKLMPDRSFVQRWATAMVFDKNSETIFSAARMVRENYGYYSAMFNFSFFPFRNDFVFSVASHLLGVPKCPARLFQSPIDTSIDGINDNGILLRYENKVVRWNFDLHVLNKDIVINSKILDSLNA